jgi:uncharacterized protein (TIGR03437 family)
MVSRRMDKMRFHGFAVLLFLISAGSLFAQCNEGGPITPASVPNGTVGTMYSAQLTENGVPMFTQVSWGLSSGSLPPGLTLNTSTTATTTTISGTPTTSGLYSFTVEAEYNDSANECSSQSYTINVAANCSPGLTPGSTSPLPPGDVSLAYLAINFMIVDGCSGSTYTFSSQANPFSPSTFPPGLNLSSTGTLNGTPTSAGTYSFPITITDQYQNQYQFQYSITISPLPTITTSSPLPNGPVGVPYSQQIAATGGTPPYIFDMNANPPGITITPSGVLNGTPTTAGTFNFNIGVRDSLGGATLSPFKVTFGTAVSQIQVSPSSLTFSAIANGGPPPTQAIALVPATGATPPVNYQVVIDDGQSGTPAPPWITVTPTSGAAPVGLVVSVNQGTMAAGSYLARIQVSDSVGFVSNVLVTLNVTSPPQQLTVGPSILNFAGPSATPGILIENLLVSNSGSGSLSFTTSVVGNSPWITSVTASSNTTTLNAPISIQVLVNTNGLQVGAYHDVILVSSSAGSVQVPVSLFVAASGPILGVNTTGVLFQAVEGGGSTATQIVQILNLGEQGSTVNWNATLVSGSNWLTLVSSSGTATTGTPGTLTLALAPNATQLTPGPYYAIVKITDPNSRNSPQYVTAVLNLQPIGTAPSPDLGPDGLFFTTPVGGAAPSAQQVQINTSSSSAVTFTAAASTIAGGNWLSVSPISGSASGVTAGSVAVSVNPAGLAAGIYSGDVNISIGPLLQSVNVTFVVQPTSSSTAISRRRPEAASGSKPEASGCTASKLAITETGLANNFAVPAGWPATLIVQLNDDCAAPVTSGSVVASFSNGDPKLNLAGDSLGHYSTTWQPGAVNSQLVVTVSASAGALQPATALLYGGIAPNQTPPPTLATGGTLNNLNPVVGAALSPGTIAQVYGTGLGSAPESTGKLPLPVTFNNTSALVGSTEAPLYFLSSGQINLQIPYEAPAPQQLPIILNVNNAITQPLMLNIVPAGPGVLSADDGPTPPNVQNGAHIIAQHADFSLVSSSSPAMPGEYLVMYLVGLGATNPSVASGAPAPTSPLATVTIEPTVTVGTQPSNVVFAGLTPGFVGLYQINFQVPTSASSGELEVDVTQNGVAANPTLLPVSD